MSAIPNALKAEFDAYDFLISYKTPSATPPLGHTPTASRLKNYCLKH